MSLATFRTGAFLGAALAALLCPGGTQAAKLLTATPNTIALTCNTLTGPGSAAAIVVSPVPTLTTNTIAVSVDRNAVVAVTAPAELNSTNQTQGLTYTVNAAAGCAGATNGSFTIRFHAGGVADVTGTANLSVVASAGGRASQAGVAIWVAPRQSPAARPLPDRRRRALNSRRRIVESPSPAYLALSPLWYFHNLLRDLCT